MTNEKLPAFRVVLRIFTRLVFMLDFRVSGRSVVLDIPLTSKCTGVHIYMKFSKGNFLLICKKNGTYPLVQIYSWDSLFWGFISCYFFFFLFFLNKFMAPIYGWGSTASKLQSFFQEPLYCLPLSYHRS